DAVDVDERLVAERQRGDAAYPDARSRAHHASAGRHGDAGRPAVDEALDFVDRHGLLYGFDAELVDRVAERALLRAASGTGYHHLVELQGRLREKKAHVRRADRDGLDHFAVAEHANVQRHGIAGEAR